MSAEIQKLIAAEQSKIVLFKEKITSCEKRIAMLQSIQSEDAVDMAVGAAIAAKPSVPVRENAFEPRTVFPLNTLGKNIPDATPKRPIGGVGMAMMHALKSGEKNLDQLGEAIESSGLKSTRHNARCTLIAFKDKYGFIENTQRGYYGLTKRGLEYIQEQDGVLDLI